VNIPAPLIDAAALGALVVAESPRTAPTTPTADVPPTLLDVRWRLGGPHGRKDYLAGHIPGATFVDLDADVCGPPGGGGRHPLPDLDALQAALRTAGVTNERPVVVYDAGDGMPAARLWWTLRWAGHPDVRVLDGGFVAWQRAGLPIETGERRVQRGDFTVVPGNLPALDADGAAAYARRGALFDARTAARFRGENEPIDPVAGRIPGAGSLPYADLVRADGMLLPAEELRKAMTQAGVPESGTVGAYCGSGVTAAHTVWAMTVAGLESPALYIGSWSEWIRDPSRPVATGARVDGEAA